MPSGTYVVEVDWDNDGTFTGTGENVTARTLRVEIDYGRDLDSQLVGRSVAGSAQILLNNVSGDYNSFNTTGTLYGSIVPGRPVQVRMTGPGTASGTLFRGFLQRIIPKPSLKALDTVVLECIGPLGFVDQYLVSVGVLSTIDSGAAISTILAQANWPVGQSSIDTGKTVLRTLWYNRQRAVEAMRQIEETEGGFLRESKDGKIVFENRWNRLTGTKQVSQATFTDAANGTLLFTSVEQEDPLPYIFTEFIATVRPFSAGVTGTLWKLQDTTGTRSPAIAPSGTFTIYATFPNPTSTNSAAGVSTWITPTATVDFNITSDTDGTGTNMNGRASIAVTSFGNQLKIIFTNNSYNPAYVTYLQVRGVPLIAGESVQVSSSSTSTAFGTRVYPLPSELMPDINEGQSWAQWHAALYATAGARFRMGFIANASTLALTQAAVREISDRVTFVATSGAGTLGVKRETYIEHIKHVIDSNRTHMVTYAMSDGTVLSDAWVVDTSELDIRTRLVY